MPSFLWCLVLEWGLGFVVGGIIAIVMICAAYGGTASFVLFRWYRRRQDQEPAEASYGDARIRGSQTLISALIVLFVVFAPMLFMAWFAYSKYEDYEKKFAVHMDLRTAPETLEEIADYYRSSTPVRIDISDAAKKVSIKGEYEGLCISDFFESICRQYDSQISCEPPSLWQRRTFTIDVKK